MLKSTNGSLLHENKLGCWRPRMMRPRLGNRWSRSSRADTESRKLVWHGSLAFCYDTPEDHVKTGWAATFPEGQVAVDQIQPTRSYQMYLGGLLLFARSWPQIDQQQTNCTASFPNKSFGIFAISATLHAGHFRSESPLSGHEKASSATSLHQETFECLLGWEENQQGTWACPWRVYRMGRDWKTSTHSGKTHTHTHRTLNPDTSFISNTVHAQ